MRKSLIRKVEKHFNSEKERVMNMRLSKDPNIARLELQAINIAEKVKKEGIDSAS